MTPATNEHSASNDDLHEIAALWRFLHDLFRSPSPEQWAWLHEPSVQAAWSTLSGQADETISTILPLPAEFSEFEQSYIAIFDVGIPEPLCPLIESYWNKRDPVPRVLHENMLFYKHFGLELRSSANETADHLRHQLEFMHYVYGFEARHPELTEQCRLARTDFLSRHLGYWVPMAVRKLKEFEADSWFTHWFSLLNACCEAEMNTEPVSP